MGIAERTSTALARNVRRLGHLDFPGAGQVTIAGFHAFGRSPPSGYSKWKERLDEASGVTDWRRHDLSRTTAGATP